MLDILYPARMYETILNKKDSHQGEVYGIVEGKGEKDRWMDGWMALSLSPPIFPLRIPVPFYKLVKVSSF